MNDEANDYQNNHLQNLCHFYELKEDNFIRLTNIYKQKGYSPTFILSTINKTICSLIHLTKSKFTTTLDTVHFIYTINKSVKFYDY